MASTSRHWLNERFTEFLAEVQRQKEAVLSGHWAYYEDEPHGDTSEHAAVSAAVNPVWQKLKELLEEQAGRSREHGASGEQLYRKAQFAMAAYADEVFLRQVPAWRGQLAWKNYPLQQAFFNTINAGQELFAEIDRLLANYNAGERSLAEVYFNVLSLGFLGVYGVGGQQGAVSRRSREVEDRKHRLYRSLSEESGSLGSRVSPSAYERIRDEDVGREIPSALQSMTLLGLVVGVLVLAVWVAGLWLRKDLGRTLETLSNRELIAPAGVEAEGEGR